jgi:hypothetical protein
VRKNEHPGCSCRACKRGKHGGGHFIVVATNRRLRRLYRLALRQRQMDAEPFTVSTPYTD